MKATVQHFPSGREADFTDVSATQLAHLLIQMEGEVGSTLMVDLGPEEFPRLIVGVDGRRFTAMAFIAKTEFYDRVGDANAAGLVDLVLGGQTTEGVPSRFVLTPDQAHEALAEFLAANQWPASPAWVRQGPRGWR